MGQLLCKIMKVREIWSCQVLANVPLQTIGFKDPGSCERQAARTFPDPQALCACFRGCEPPRHVSNTAAFLASTHARFPGKAGAARYGLSQTVRACGQCRITAEHHGGKLKPIVRSPAGNAQTSKKSCSTVFPAREEARASKLHPMKSYPRA